MFISCLTLSALRLLAEILILIDCCKTLALRVALQCLRKPCPYFFGLILRSACEVIRMAASIANPQNVYFAKSKALQVQFF